MTARQSLNDTDQIINYLSNEQYRKIAKELYDELRTSYEYLQHHKPSLGNFGEYILRGLIKRVLPNHIGITQGFVKGKYNTLSPQCDIIIYTKKTDAILKSFGEIQIVSNKSVLSVIEVKTSIQRKTFESTLNAFKELARLGISENYIFIYNPISLQTLCSYLYSKNKTNDEFTIGEVGKYDFGDENYLPTAICNLKSNYFLCQDYIINERDQYGYIAYQLKDDETEIASLQMFIGAILDKFYSDNDTHPEGSTNIDFNYLNILYSVGLWYL